MLLWYNLKVVLAGGFSIFEGHERVILMLDRVRYITEIRRRM